MRLADGWKDYQIIDTDSGEKLERWGNITLVRPDPQIIWKSKRDAAWDAADAVYHRSKSGGGKWELKKQIPGDWKINYNGLTFKISPTGFKHTGLFPEEAVNWDLFGAAIKKAGRPIKVLNLFAYTGGATLACAKAGAAVTHVDASKGMVAWAKENAELSGLRGAPVRYIVDDCEKFVRREIKRRNFYDAVIMDPPSYGRGPGGEVWKLEDCVYDLVKLCTGVLSDQPLFFAINSYTTGLSASVMEYILGLCLPRRGKLFSGEIGLPVKKSGMALPCGSTAIWMEK